MSSKLILRRIGLGILTLWLVSLVVFAAVIALPGDAATAILGKEATPDRVAALRDQLHLNESVVTQYTQWLKGILTFNLGDSAATQQPVTQLLSDRRRELGVPRLRRVDHRDPAVDRDRRLDGDEARQARRPRDLDRHAGPRGAARVRRSAWS